MFISWPTHATKWYQQTCWSALNTRGETKQQTHNRLCQHSSLPFYHNIIKENMNFTKPTNCTWYLCHKFIQGRSFGHNLSDFKIKKEEENI